MDALFTLSAVWRAVSCPCCCTSRCYSRWTIPARHLNQSCTLGTDPASVGDRTVSNATATPTDNAKLAAGLFEPNLNATPACLSRAEKQPASWCSPPAAGRLPAVKPWA
ncbi:hypothetical protein N657DRAFT_651793 [Parathielavia appendiculata]|uniref:Secreted protein n=1 Tax=Parathielavia appendiculata TaxID=2587402 RepID=A0AAN6YXN8_9PEZI|nr:hypothetical protein N657DRAFT_651793 [Parathielavia appendiculata]